MKKKKVYKLARRRSFKRAFGRSRGGSSKGMIGNTLDGVIVGAIQGFVPDDALFGFADPLVMAGVGWWRKNQTLQTLAGYQAGLKISKMFGGNQTNIGGVNSQV